MSTEIFAWVALLAMLLSVLLLLKGKRCSSCFKRLPKEKAKWHRHSTCSVECGASADFALVREGLYQYCISKEKENG